jgi:hypothetical protein
MRETELASHVESRVERYRNELRSVLTIGQCAAMFHKSARTVRKHVEEGVLFAEKQDETEYNPRSGHWNIPFSAAYDLYGTDRTVYNVIRDGSIRDSSEGVV